MDRAERGRGREKQVKGAGGHECLDLGYACMVESGGCVRASRPVWGTGGGDLTLVRPEVCMPGLLCWVEVFFCCCCFGFLFVLLCSFETRFSRLASNSVIFLPQPSKCATTPGFQV